MQVATKTMLTKLTGFLRRLRSEQGRKTNLYIVAQKLINPIARGMGYTVLADHYAHPIPSNRELLLYSQQERPLGSIDWHLQRQLDLVKRLLNEYRGEFNNAEIMSSFGYQEATSGVMSGDAEFLFAMIRDIKPSRIIEIGAGGSTLIMMAALHRNFSETQRKTTFVSIEPYPRNILDEVRGRTHDFVDFNLLERNVQEVDSSVFEGLEENDILFVDSSHVFKQGSDVEFEFLKVYPALSKGTLVHIHDIFFPFDYPLEWNNRSYRFWNEQYFLETFLQCNRKYEVVASLSMVSHHNNSIFLNSITAYHEDRKPGSFWMKAIRGQCKS